MEINWFTVIAQIINFLILVWLLKRFLYQPVLNAIDQREKKIASQLADAATKKVEAENEQNMFRQKNEVFDKERVAKMNEAREEVNSEKQRLFEEVRKESTALRSKYEDSLKQQEQEISDSLKRRTKDEVFAIAQKTLADLANANLEEQAIKVFIKKIQELNDDDNEKLKNAFDNDKAITIKSAFELSANPKQELENAIEKITGHQNTFEYLSEPELVSGIEINTENYQLAWNIESYLDSLKKNSITNENATLEFRQNNR